MKRDLTEFTQVVQRDTACTIAATASVVKEKLTVSAASTPQSLSAMFHNLLF